MELPLLGYITGGGYHKIKHFACHRDFFLHEIPRIKHTQNASFPGIKHFRAMYAFYTWNSMHKEISVTSKMFYFMLAPVVRLSTLKTDDFDHLISAHLKALKTYLAANSKNRKNSKTRKKKKKASEKRKTKSRS